MRKILILAFSLLLGIYAQAGEIIHFNVSIFDDMPIGNGHGKPSIEVPKVYIKVCTRRVQYTVCPSILTFSLRIFVEHE